MTLNTAEQLLDGFLGDATSSLGFQRTETLIFSQTLNEATALLAFPCRLDPRGFCCFGCSVWLRFKSVEQQLRGDSAKATIPTISMPLHLLRENRSFTEWQFHERDDLGQLQEIIMSDLREYALPFIEQYSKLAEVRRNLELPSENWFVLNPEQRLSVLAVIQFLQGDKLGALKTLDDGLLERKTALPKKRLPLEAVRNRLATAD